MASVEPFVKTSGGCIQHLRGSSFGDLLLEMCGFSMCFRITQLACASVSASSFAPWQHVTKLGWKNVDVFSSIKKKNQEGSNKKHESYMTKRA